MTVFLPLDGPIAPPTTPSFLEYSADPAAHVQKVVKAIMKAKRLVVVSGAGISVKAGIPDFRSSDGLFQTLKRDNPKESLLSGKDLFDASVFNFEHTTSLFCHMIAQLSQLSQAASPTPFHQLLRTLDDRGSLLRVYTQNIDAIEAKSGLSFGVPQFEDRRHKHRSKVKGLPSCADEHSIPSHGKIPLQAASSGFPRVETPRCIPLHGTLQTMHCQICTHRFPLANYLPSLASGTPPDCPECVQMEETRQLIGKRARGIGRLRPSVVLYNEAHKDGEGVGEVVQKDLVGCSKGKGRSGADLLLVVGTSLRVPGTKRIVREFSKAVKARGKAASLWEYSDQRGNATGLLSPSPSPRRTPVSSSEDDHPVRTIYLNLDFPVPTREWEGVFDTWIQGDAQDFAAMVAEEIKKEGIAKEAALERKRRREEAAVASLADKCEVETLPAKKRKLGVEVLETSTPSAQLGVRRRQAAANSSAGRSKMKKQAAREPLAIPKTPEAHPKIYLRIPAPKNPFPAKVLPIPHVYIATPALKNVKRVKMQTPLTPPPSELPHRPRNSRNPSRAREDIRHARQTDRLRDTGQCLLDSSGEEESEGELPLSLVRTVQYGLRVSEG